MKHDARAAAWHRLRFRLRAKIRVRVRVKVRVRVGREGGGLAQAVRDARHQLCHLMIAVVELRVTQRAECERAEQGQQPANAARNRRRVRGRCDEGGRDAQPRGGRGVPVWHVTWCGLGLGLGLQGLGLGLGLGLGPGLGPGLGLGLRRTAAAASPSPSCRIHCAGRRASRAPWR